MKDYDTAVFVGDCKLLAAEKGFITRVDVSDAFWECATDLRVQLRNAGKSDAEVAAAFERDILPGLLVQLKQHGVTVR